MELIGGSGDEEIPFLDLFFFRELKRSEPYALCIMQNRPWWTKFNDFPRGRPFYRTKNIQIKLPVYIFEA